MLCKPPQIIVCVAVCKSNGLHDIICIWKLDDEPQCTFQIQETEGIFLFANRTFKHVGTSESFHFSTLKLRNNIIVFVPPHGFSLSFILLLLM
jgi:hypothetical protein